MNSGGCRLALALALLTFPFAARGQAVPRPEAESVAPPRPGQFAATVPATDLMPAFEPIRVQPLSAATMLDRTEDGASPRLGYWLMAGGGLLMAIAVGNCVAEPTCHGLTGFDAGLYGGGLALFGFGGLKATPEPPPVVASVRPPGR